MLGISWDPLWNISVICLWFGMPKLETVSKSMFLLIQGWKCCLNAVAACARTTVKPVVFEWFHSFTYSLIWCPVGGIWLTFWYLLVTLGSLFLKLKGIGSRLEIWWFCGDARENPETREHTQVRVNGTVQGPRNTPKSKIPVFSLLVSSLRYQTGRLQTGSCRLVDWKNR